jgi:hypothetical protein
MCDLKIKWTSMLQIMLFSTKLSVLEPVIRLKIKIITNEFKTINLDPPNHKGPN